MTDDEKIKLTQEMFVNTVEFLEREMTLQLKFKDTSFTEDIQIKTALIKNVLIHHIFMLSKFSDVSPQDVLKSFNLEYEVNSISDKLKTYTCPDCQKIHA